MFDNLMNKRIIMVLPVVAALTLAGCKDDKASVPASDSSVNLSKTEDMFTAPVKPNPLTTDTNAVVVKVNGEDITQGEIMKMMNAAMQQIGGQVSPDKLKQVQAQIYTKIKNDLITQKLIQQAVAAAKIKVDPSEVDATIEKIKSSIPKGQTLEGILKSRGEDLASLKKNIADNMAAKKLMEAKTADIPEATEAEAKAFYDKNPDKFVKPETVTASHILIKVDPTDTAETKAKKKAKLEEIRKNIIAGTISFEDAAKKNSEGPSASRGGELGTFRKGQMVPKFEAAAFSQEVGKVGPVIETKFGYHIIKVTAHQKKSTMSFDDVKKQLITYLTNQKKQKAVSDYIDALRNKATIEEM